MKINDYLYQRPFELKMKLKREKNTPVCNDAVSGILSKTMATKLLKPMNLPNEETQSIFNRGMLEHSTNKSDIYGADINDILDVNGSQKD